MHNILSRTLRSGALQIAFVGAVAVAAFGMHDGGSCEANSQTLEQLKAARQATGGFNSIIAAEAVGYSNAHITIPNMGDHWVNFDLVDTTFDPAKPEAMVYDDLGTGNLQLVAVEYLAPYDPAGPPEGFAGTCDQWVPFPSAENPILWTLHAWIWQPNLSGTFAEFNPLVP